MASLLRSSPALSSLLSSVQCSALRGFLPAACHLHTSPELHNANKTCVARAKRTNFKRSYPVLLVQPDGSTITISYKEPRRLLTMPIDVTTLSEEERKARQRARDQAHKVAVKQEEVYDDIHQDEYKKFWKKK